MSSTTLHLDIYKRYANERYHIVYFGNGTLPKNADIVNDQCKITPQKQIYAFYLLVYATINERVCTYLGHSKYLEYIGGEEYIYDALDQVCGKITIEQEFSLLKQLEPSTSLSQKLVVQDLSIYTSGNIEYDRGTQVFYEIYTIHGKFPMVALPLQCTLVSKPDVVWLDQCFQTAMSLHGYQDLSDVIFPYDVAGTAMTLLLNLFHYEDDYVRGSLERSGVDNWMNLLLSPNLSKTGYDCEDGTLFVITMFYAITSCVSDKISTPNLFYFADLLRKYTIGSAQCELNIDSQKIAHSVPILIETKELRARIHNKPYEIKLPPLLIETTSWQTSTWEQRPYLDYLTVQKNVDARAKVLQQASTTMNSLYGKICKVQFPFLDDCAVSVSIVNQRNQMNVTMREFLVQRQGTIIINSKLSITETEQLKQEMIDFPKFELPKKIEGYVRPKPLLGYPVLYDMDDKQRFIAYEGNKQVKVTNDYEVGYFVVSQSKK